MSADSHIMTDEEIKEYLDESLDRVFLKEFGKTFHMKKDGKDSLMQIEHDFPSLFGGEGKA